MSGIIPMVSSSPPPLMDEDENYGNDDDYGGFTSGPSVNAGGNKYGNLGDLTTVLKDTDKNTPTSEDITHDPAAHEDWADFAEFDAAATTHSSDTNVTNDHPADNDSDCTSKTTDSGQLADSKIYSKPTKLNLVNSPVCGTEPTMVASNISSSNGDNRNGEPTQLPSSESLSSVDLQIQASHAYKTHKPDSQDNTSQGSMTDSGMCSDISPVPKFDEYPDFVEQRQDSDFHVELDSKRRTSSKECSPSLGEQQQIKDTDSGQGIELNDIPSQHTFSASLGEDKELDLDISPNEETLVTDSISDLQLPEHLSDSDSDPEIVPSEEPAPLDLKLPAFTGDEESGGSDFDDFIVTPHFSSPPNISDIVSSECPSTHQPDNIGTDNHSENAKDMNDTSESSGADYPEYSECTITDDTSTVIITENDDFGQFADFSSKDTAGSLDQAGQSDNDWAAFSGPSTSAEVTENNSGDWASFHDTATPHTVAEDEDDDFGDFESDNKTHSQTFTSVKETAEERLERALGDCFFAQEIVPQKETFAIQLLLDGLEVEVPREQEAEQPSPKMIVGLNPRQREIKSKTIDINIWNNLKDMERSIGLKYQWSKSNGSQRLLHALGIDTRNMLKNKRPAVPIFASQLGLLEPSKDSVAKPNDEESEPVIVDTSKSVLPATTPQDIPPAQFDWSSSGLTNPLDASSSVPLDLDFFVKNDTASHSSNASQSEVLKKEKEILQALEQNMRAPVPRTLEPLENLLANMKFTPTTPSSMGRRDIGEDSMSQEARGLAGKLNNLSFMRASVLMFPVKENAD